MMKACAQRARSIHSHLPRLLGHGDVIRLPRFEVPAARKADAAATGDGIVVAGVSCLVGRLWIGYCE
jgi:hypothetical protein|eukprot:COSAG01_NODE_3586_length_5907_cov_7.984504_7_plen_67_part_00